MTRVNCAPFVRALCASLARALCALAGRALCTRMARTMCRACAVCASRACARALHKPCTNLATVRCAPVRGSCASALRAIPGVPCAPSLIYAPLTRPCVCAHGFYAFVRVPLCVPIDHPFALHVSAPPPSFGALDARAIHTACVRRTQATRLPY
eukprot:6212162-Pleurochrysis_carterae.AAC.1